MYDHCDELVQVHVTKTMARQVEMLTRYPELNTKILPLMEDYLVALRYVIFNGKICTKI